MARPMWDGGTPLPGVDPHVSSSGGSTYHTSQHAGHHLKDWPEPQSTHLARCPHERQAGANEGSKRANVLCPTSVDTSAGGLRVTMSPCQPNTRNSLRPSWVDLVEGGLAARAPGPMPAGQSVLAPKSLSPTSDWPSCLEPLRLSPGPCPGCVW